MSDLDTPPPPPPPQHQKSAGLLSAAVAIVAIVAICLIWWKIIPSTTVTCSATASEVLNNICRMQEKVGWDFDLVNKSNVIVQIILFISALAAAVLAAITTSENANRTKFWSVTLTSTTAALATLLSTFHVRENINAFADLQLRLNRMEEDYNLDQVQKSSDLTDPLKKATLEKGYWEKLDDVEAARFKIWGNIGPSLGSGGNSPPPPAPPSPQAPNDPKKGG